MVPPPHHAITSPPRNVISDPPPQHPHTHTHDVPTLAARSDISSSKNCRRGALLPPGLHRFLAAASSLGLSFRPGSCCRDGSCRRCADIGEVGQVPVLSPTQSGSSPSPQVEAASSSLMDRMVCITKRGGKRSAVGAQPCLRQEGRPWELSHACRREFTWQCNQGREGSLHTLDT